MRHPVTCLAFVAAALAVAALAPPRAAAETVTAGLSDIRVNIESQFVGTDLTLFGIVERDARTIGRVGGYDVAVVVRGPEREMVTWRKERVLGIWVNRHGVTFGDVPSYYAVLASRPLGDIAGSAARARHEIGLSKLDLQPISATDDPDAFREALLRRKAASGLYIEDGRAVEMMTPTLFSTRIPLPAHIRTGAYVADIYVFADRTLVATEQLGFWVAKSGFEARVFHLSERYPFFYGLGAVAIALFAGWFAGVIFRRD